MSGCVEGAGWIVSKASFTLMTQPGHKHDVGAFIKSVSGDVSGIAEGNNQFPNCFRSRQKASHLGHRSQGLKMGVDRVGGFLRCAPIFDFEEAPAAVDTSDRAPRQDYLWHGGGSPSASVPHVFSQALTSSSVR